MKINEKILLILYFIIVAVAGAIFNFSFLVSTLFFFVGPSLYVTLKRPKIFKPLSAYAFLIGIPFVLIIDTIATYNNSWWETSVFAARIFDGVTFDNVLWAVLYAYTIPALYEYFFGNRESINLSKRFWRFEAGLLVALAVFLITFSINRSWFTIPYFYAVFVGLFYILTSIIALLRQSKEYIRLLLQCLFLFSPLLLIGELGALAANQWGFAGTHYLGIIHLWNLSFPFEEMIWILIGVPAFIYVYLGLTNLKE